MAVQQNKKSPSKRGMHHSHDFLVNPPLAVEQTDDMVRFQKQSTKEMKEHFKGMMQTVWSGAGSFLDGFYGRKKEEKDGENTPAAPNTFGYWRMA